MFAIETELGRFEAETDREAKRALRKAEREAKKQEAIDNENRELARLKARSAAFKHLSNYIDGKNAICSPWIIRPEDNYWPAKQVDSNEWSVSIDNSNEVSVPLTYHKPIACLINCAGDMELLWTEDQFTNERERGCVAVGYHADQTAYEYLPKELTPEFYEN